MKKILVIDDEGLITRTVGNLLKREGYEILAAASGQEALISCQANHFDLIVSDLRMPGMDGLETSGKIREDCKRQKKPEIPFVFITGYAEGDLHLKAAQYGKVIFKPFDMQDFLKAIRLAMAREKK